MVAARARTRPPRQKMKYAPPYLQALHTDGTPVKAGDRIRSRQQPGGILAPAPPTEGTAATCPWDESGTLYLKHLRPSGHVAYKHIAGHITERVSP